MKKILPVILIVLLCASTVFAFPDLPPNHWAAEVILRVSSEYPNVIGGYPDGTVQPSRTVTRAEFIKMITAGLGVEISDSSSANFTDMNNNHWAMGNVHTAINLGIVVRSEEGSRFRPSDGITREDMAKYVVRAIGYDTPSNTVNVSDAGQISSSHRKYVATAMDTGLLGGYPDGTFGPKRTLTRAEAFSVIDRFLTQLNDGPPQTDKPAGTPFNPDITVSDSDFTHDEGWTYNWEGAGMQFITPNQLPHQVGRVVVQNIDIRQSHIDITYYRDNSASTSAPYIVLAVGTNITRSRSPQEVVSQTAIGSGIQFTRRYLIPGTESTPTNMSDVTDIVIDEQTQLLVIELQ